MNKRHVLSACAGVVLAFNSATVLADGTVTCASLGLRPDGASLPMDFMHRDGQLRTGKVDMLCSNPAIVDEYRGKREIVYVRLRDAWTYVVETPEQEAQIRNKEPIFLSDSQADVAGGALLKYALGNAKPDLDVPGKACTTYHNVQGTKRIGGRDVLFWAGTMTFCRPY